MRDAILYRSAYREIAAWSRAADELEALVHLEPAEAWRRTIALCRLCLKLAPEPSAAQLVELGKDRARYLLRMRLFEARRRHQRPS